MVRIAMAAVKQPLLLSRRALLAGFSAAALLPVSAGRAGAQTIGPQRSVRLRDTTVRLRGAEAETAAWRFNPDTDSGHWSFRQGDTLELDLINAVPAPINLNWYGLDGVPGAVPLLAQDGIAAGKRATRSIPLRAAGTWFFETRIGNETAARPLPCGAFAVQEVQRYEIRKL